MSTRPGTRLAAICIGPSVCGGECWRCNSRQRYVESLHYAALAVRYFDMLNVSGSFGPWSDNWTEADGRFWIQIEKIREDAGEQIAALEASPKNPGYVPGDSAPAGREEET